MPWKEEPRTPSPPLWQPGATAALPYPQTPGGLHQSGLGTACPIPGDGGTCWLAAQSPLPSCHVAHIVPLLHTGSRVGRGQCFSFIFILCSLNKAQALREKRFCSSSLLRTVRTPTEYLLHYVCCLGEPSQPPPKGGSHLKLRKLRLRDI